MVVLVFLLFGHLDGEEQDELTVLQQGFSQIMS
jgi:hypothetical protein